MLLSLALLTVMPTAVVGTGLLLLLKQRRDKQLQVQAAQVRARRIS